MGRGATGLLIAVGALVAGLLVAPTPALADRRPGGPDGRHHPRPRSAAHRHVHHRHFHRPTFPVATFWAPLLAYAPSSVLYDAPSYPAPPMVYDPPPLYPSAPATYGPAVSGMVVVAQAAPPPPAPPTPSVIEDPTGRYELRGDGMAMAYTWVWVPNPPPPPPAGPPPDVSAPAAPASSSTDRAPARRTELYRWTDEQGVEHWTDRRDRVPEKYRSRSKRPDPS